MVCNHKDFWYQIMSSYENAIIGFDAISLMPYNELYGPGDNYKVDESHVLPSLIRKFDEALKNNHIILTCWGTGKPLREFLHVDDLAIACLYVLENWMPFLPIYENKEKFDSLGFLNVGSGEEISIKSLAELIAKRLDLKK